MGGIFKEGRDCSSAISQEEIMRICGWGGSRENEPATDFAVQGCTSVKGSGEFLSPCGEGGEVVSF